MKVILLFAAIFCAVITSVAETPIVFGISPYYFSRGQNVIPLKEIQKRLPEIKDLGANIVWLQPITPTSEPSQGYDTTDYFSINPDLGTAEDFKKLVAEAHRLNLKIILDVALNHTSLHHPMAKDLIQQGEQSKYSVYYQKEKFLSIPYSEYFNEKKVGKAQFIYYFWENLVNLNFSSDEVRKYVLNVLEFWVKEYDIDGYRFDASWGPQSRWPHFYKSVNAHLRKIKPNLFLLAEDHSAYPARYKSKNHPHLKNSGFDAAYDWNSEDPDYVSKWAFNIEDDMSVFNFGDRRFAKDYFFKTIERNKKNQSVPPLRYLENNDTESFLYRHSRKQTMFAAATMILLPGYPLIYYTQPLGLNYTQWNLPSINPAKPLSEYDPELWAYYKKLLHLKKRSQGSSIKIDFDKSQVYVNGKPVVK
jgi:glycosidase